MWNNNLIQFARLICEIQATQDNLDIDALCASMDLKPLDISELFDRAVDVWHEVPGDNDQAICVHCDESHDLDADHQCKDGVPDLEPTHFNCCHAPKDLGHMFGCPNSPENKRGEADLLGTLKSTVEWLQTGKVDGVGFDEQSIIDDLVEAITKAKGGE